MTSVDQWLHSAPAHWTRGRLKDLISTATNGTWGSDPVSDGNDVRCVRAADFDRVGRRANLSTAPLRSVEPSALHQHLLRPGDLILEKSGGGEKQPVGMAVLFTDSIKAVCSNFCARVKPSVDIDSRFLTYVFAAAYGQGLSQAATKQTTGIQNLDTGVFFASRWAFPAKEEQRRIAEFLDAEIAHIDRLTSASRKQSSLLDERLTEHFRMLTTSGGQPSTGRTGVSWMPTMAPHWELCKIGRSFKTSSGTTPRSGDSACFDGNHFWVNTGDLRDGTVDRPKRTVTDIALSQYPTLKIYGPGSLVVAMYGATTGRVGILGVPACVNQACCVLSDLGPVDPQYAFYWFRAHRREILRLASGGGQPNISQDLVRSLHIPAPPRMEQADIVARAAQRERQTVSERSLLTHRNNLLSERRQALITAAVTGQFDVTTASGRNVTEGVSV
ncbi:restriction endonuclease subunit S [Streptomyces sp. NPDC012616]|uniref:restriction endonuclease subunit S n=1 Tax=Streptomyces sp. NPDC012616 TaxID=3364840 RepID=UPI0036E13272